MVIVLTLVVIGHMCRSVGLLATLTRNHDGGQMGNRVALAAVRINTYIQVPEPYLVSGCTSMYSDKYIQVQLETSRTNVEFKYFNLRVLVSVSLSSRMSKTDVDSSGIVCGG